MHLLACLQLVQILRLDSLWTPESVILRRRPNITSWSRQGLLCRLYLTLSLGAFQPLFLLLSLMLCQGTLRSDPLQAKLRCSWDACRPDACQSDHGVWARPVQAALLLLLTCKIQVCSFALCCLAPVRPVLRHDADYPSVSYLFVSMAEEGLVCMHSYLLHISLRVCGTAPCTAPHMSPYLQSTEEHSPLCSTKSEGCHPRFCMDTSYPSFTKRGCVDQHLL